MTKSKKASPFSHLDPHGEEGILKRGHRGYVGGLWEQLGKLQFDFLVSRGLRPESRLLDIACGSLRLGVKAIPYLDPGHYLGIEKEAGLVEAGLEIELGSALRESKQPRIVISDSFEFENLGTRGADFAMAQSLFTHLPPDRIELCFGNLFPWLAHGALFYATFFRTERKIENPEIPHDHGFFGYTRQEMIDFGDAVGFRSRYLGDWNHPRNQVMVEYRKPAAAPW